MLLEPEGRLLHRAHPEERANENHASEDILHITTVHDDLKTPSREISDTKAKTLSCRSLTHTLKIDGYKDEVWSERQVIGTEIESGMEPAYARGYKPDAHLQFTSPQIMNLRIERRRTLTQEETVSQSLQESRR